MDCIIVLDVCLVVAIDLLLVYLYINVSKMYGIQNVVNIENKKQQYIYILRLYVHFELILIGILFITS